MHYIHTVRKTALKDNVESTSASIRSFGTGYTVGNEWEGRLGHQGPRSRQQEACWLSRQRRDGSLSHLGSLGRGLRAQGGAEFGRSADALIKPRVRFPAQLSTNAAVQARNEYSQSANRRKCFTKTEPEGVKGKQALFTRRQTAAAAQHSPEEAETQA